MGRYNKTLLRVLMACCVLGISYTTFAAKETGKPKTVQWQTDLKAARKVAVKSGKPMLLVFTADWCGYCKKMEKLTLNHPKMAEYINDEFVPILVDFDKEKEVVKVLEVKSIPCSIILSPDVDLLGRHVGYASTKEYFKELDKTRELNKKIQQVRATQDVDEN